MLVGEKRMSYRSRVLSFALVAALAAPVVAQQTNPQPTTATTTQTTTPTPQTQEAPTKVLRPSGLPDYSKPRSHIFNPIAPYMPQHPAQPSFGNAARIDKLIQNGDLRLSLNDAIALALENNLDLAIARYNLEIADTDILLAKAGQGIRGVSTGVVQGTQGGGVGGFGTGAQGAGAGGTTTGAGGAGSGTSGLVQST